MNNIEIIKRKIINKENGEQLMKVIKERIKTKKSQISYNSDKRLVIRINNDDEDILLVLPQNVSGKVIGFIKHYVLDSSAWDLYA